MINRLENIDIVLKKLEKIVEIFGSQKRTAWEIGVSTAYLNDVLLRRKEPGPKILFAIGYDRVVMYRRKK